MSIILKDPALTQEIKSCRSFDSRLGSEMKASSKVTIKSGYENMDFKAVADLLSRAFWSPGIKQKEVEQGAQNSALVVGAFTEGRKQIGYARVISDKTRFAYILDVFVHEDYRRRGIGREIIRSILNSRELKDVYQWLLITRDSHEFYKKSGFSAIRRANDWMEIRAPRPER